MDTAEGELWTDKGAQGRIPQQASHSRAKSQQQEWAHCVWAGPEEAQEAMVTVRSQGTRSKTSHLPWQLHLYQ